MTLAELQATFWSLATRSPAPEPAAVFVSTAELDAAARIDIYADMYEWRLVDALREDFPKLAALLGDERFYALAAAYLRAHPSSHPSLSRFGRALPAFVAAQPDLRPDAADLAALEWARAEVFEEANVPAATPADLAALATDDFASAVLRVVPALRLLRLAHDALAPWQALEDRIDDDHAADGHHHAGAADVDSAIVGETCAVVWRTDFEIFHVGISEVEATALEAALGGATVGDICAAFADQPEPIESALRAIGSWFTEGWIAAPA